MPSLGGSGWIALPLAPQAILAERCHQLQQRHHGKRLADGSGAGDGGEGAEAIGIQVRLWRFGLENGASHPNLNRNGA